MWDSCDISFKANEKTPKIQLDTFFTSARVFFTSAKGFSYLKFQIKFIFLFLLGRTFAESRQKNEEKVKNVKIVIFDIYEGKGKTETSQ